MRYKFPLLLCVAWSLHAAGNALWVVHDSSLRAWDSGPHLEAAAYAYGMVSEEGFGGIVKILRGSHAGSWPSAGYLVWVALAKLFGLSLTTARLFNVIYLGIAMAALYWLGRRIHSPAVGALAAVLMSLYPAVYGESRQFGADFPAMAITTACMALLVATRRFSSAKSSALLGIALGLGILIRPHILFYLTLPLVVGSALGLLRPAAPNSGRLKPLLCMSLAVSLAVLLSAVWWFGRVGEIWHFFIVHQGQPSRVFESSPKFYLRMLPWCFSLFSLLFTALSLGILVRRGAVLLKRGSPLLLVVAWIAGSFLVLSMIQTNYLRFMLPVCPAVGLLTALGLVAIPRRKVRQSVVATSVMVAVGTCVLDSTTSSGWLFLGFGPPPLGLSNGPVKRHRLLLSMDRIADLIAQKHSPRVVPPYKEVVVILSAFQRRHHLNYLLCSPILRTRLPRVRLGYDPPAAKDHHRSTDISFNIGGAYLPTRAPVSRPVERYFFILADTGDQARDRISQMIGDGCPKKIAEIKTGYAYANIATLWKVVSKKPCPR